MAMDGAAALRKTKEVKGNRGRIPSGSKGRISYELLKPVPLFSFLIYSICNLNKALCDAS